MPGAPIGRPREADLVGEQEEEAVNQRGWAVASCPEAGVSGVSGVGTTGVALGLDGLFGSWPYPRTSHVPLGKLASSPHLARWNLPSPLL